MAPKKRPSRVRPKSPARVRKRKRARRQGARGNHDLLGLGLLAAGLFLAVVTWLEGNGGIVGTTIADWLDALFGAARIGVPIVFLVLGALMIARASLVDVRPFRTGLALVCVGGLILLGAEKGGAFGTASDAVFGRLIGGTGTFILGLFLVWGGALLLTGASLGALLHRSAHLARDTAGAARRSVTSVRAPSRDDLPWGQTLDQVSNGQGRQPPPVDGEEAYPDVVGDAPPHQPVLVDQLSPLESELALETDDVPEPPSLFDSRRRASTTTTASRTRDVLRRSRPHDGQPGKAAERTAEALLQALGHFGIDATLVGQVVGPAGDALRASARAGDEGRQGVGAQGRPRLRAGDDRDPHPRADPRQAGGRRRGSEPLSEHRHPRGHLRRAPLRGEPALGLARQGHLRRLGPRRPRADAAHPDRRHDRLGEVRLHQHDALLDPPAGDARTRCA